jgi:hypothetical protein
VVNQLTNLGQRCVVHGHLALEEPDVDAIMLVAVDDLVLLVILVVELL